MTKIEHFQRLRNGEDRWPSYIFYLSGLHHVEGYQYEKTEGKINENTFNDSILSIKKPTIK